MEAFDYQANRPLEVCLQNDSAKIAKLLIERGSKLVNDAHTQSTGEELNILDLARLRGNCPNIIHTLEQMGLTANVYLSDY